jgi:hypothetical protein
VRGNHPGLARVVEQAAGVDNGPDVTERLEGVRFTGGLDGDSGFVEINDDDVAGLELRRKGDQLLSQG